MISISAVVTAPAGIANCLIPDDFLVEADDESLELIIVDASKNYADQSRAGLLHIAMPSADIYDLLTAGLLRAKKDWVLFFEDHGRPMPGLLQAYRDAIEDNPEVDLMSGALANLESVSPWSFACFLYGGDVFWPPARQHPNGPTIAHLMVRRNAVLPSEAVCRGGLETLTVGRLVTAGRYMHCPTAVVDHVKPMTFREALAFKFHSAKHATVIRRNIMPRRGLALQTLRDCLGLVYHPTIVPLQTLYRVRGTEQFCLALWMRLVLLGVAVALGVCWADIKGLGAKRI